MSDPAGFIARWSRLKHESSAAVQPEPAGPSPAPEAVDGTTDAGPGTEMSVAPAFDLASLPPVESIVAGSDIRPFLQMGVPANLTRAALRSAWAADPAIRDFIGIAENQWDFNDPAGIPGFGPLGATDVERGFVGRVLGTVGTASAAIAGAAALAAPPLAAILDPRRDEHVDEVWLSSARSIESRPDADAASEAPEINRVDAATGRLPGTRRLHGSALPK
jgi:Protein of unknown function (DUF3306)